MYVTNLNLNAVTAIDTANNRTTIVRGTPPALNGPLGIAISPDGNTAYVTNSSSNTVTPIGLHHTSFTLETPIRVGGGPAAIAISPNGATAYVSNFNSNTVTPIDRATSTPGRPISVGAGPWSIAVSPDGKWVYVSNSEGQSVSVINTMSRAMTLLRLSSAPQAIAVAPNGAVAYVANGKLVTPIDLASGTPVLETGIAVPNGPLGIAVTPDGSMAYTANTDDTVTPSNLATTPAKPGDAFSVGSITQPDGIAISPDGQTAYVANATNTVTPIDFGATSRPKHSFR